MRKLLLKLRPKTTWAKINLALTVVMFLAYGGLLYMRATMGGVYFPDPNDCSKYYEFVNGAAISHKCPAGLLFCPQLNTCYWEDESQCTYECIKGGSGDNDDIKKIYRQTDLPCMNEFEVGGPQEGRIYICIPHPSGNIGCRLNCFAIN